MHGSMVIKWAHRLTTAILLILVAGFLILNHTTDPRAEDELVRSFKVSDHQWLYMTRSSGGGATVPAVYRYYLSAGLQGTDKEKLKRLKESSPLIEGTGSISNIKLNDDGSLTIDYSGKLYSLSGDVERLKMRVRN